MFCHRTFPTWCLIAVLFGFLQGLELIYAGFVVAWVVVVVAVEEIPSVVVAVVEVFVFAAVVVHAVQFEVVMLESLVAVWCVLVVRLEVSASSHSIPLPFLLGVVFSASTLNLRASISSFCSWTVAMISAWKFPCSGCVEFSGVPVGIFFLGLKLYFCMRGWDLKDGPHQLTRFYFGCFHVLLLFFALNGEITRFEGYCPYWINKPLYSWELSKYGSSSTVAGNPNKGDISMVIRSSVEVLYL